MLHYALHKLREADLLREADRQRTLRAAAESRPDPPGRPRLTRVLAPTRAP
ncbi:hypothetical protein [Kitasatospora camelliae]|uniref:Uncharacterized protein n=1 Tax=Kitasatospora camelliae TaxID=3156397 RepID=A0AAU8JRW4_9ACTN